MKKKDLFIFILVLFGIAFLSPAVASNSNNQNSKSDNYNVLEYGAKADGKTKETRFVQAAIDSCNAQGGGTVFFPAGRYLCGSLHLKSNVALSLDHGATILMSPDNNDFDPYEILNFKTAGDKETSYFHYALIWGEDVEHISITGTGTIDGNRIKRGGPKPIALKRCRFVNIQDITIKDAPNYNISMLGSDFVNITGVNILNGFSDGIDPDGCQNVRISNCYIDCYDDAIVPKASYSLGYLRAVENMTVTNCILASNCNAFKFGTESGGNFKNVTLSNCVIIARKTGRPADSGISLESVDGAEVEGVTITNIAMTNVTSPIFLRLGNRGRDMAVPKPGYLKNVIISGITAVGVTQASIIAGIPGYPVEDISISDFKVVYQGGGSFKGKNEDVPEKVNEYPDSDMFGQLPAYAFYCRHAKNLKLNNIEFTLKNPDPRSAFIFEDVTKLNLISSEAERSDGAAPVIWFKDASQVVIRGCSIPKDKAAFIAVPEAQKHNIQLIDNIIQK